MQRLSSASVLALLLSQSAEAYKVRNWADMPKKAPLSENLMNNIVHKYGVIYTLGFNSLVAADADDTFKVQ